MTRRPRLVAVMTHPVQYLAPWFRFIHRKSTEIDLAVIYVSEPAPRQQGVGFGTSFAWDVPLREGYESIVLRASKPSDRYASESFMGLDAPNMASAIAESSPDVILLNGWHSVSLVRAMLASRKRGVPLLYRGDTHLAGRGQSVRDLPWRVRTRYLLGRFDRYLSVGIRSRQYLESFGLPDRSIFHSPHAVDNDFFCSRASPFQCEPARTEARRGWGFAPDDDVVLFVGKLDANKRPLDLIHAVSVERKAKILLAGSGPIEEVCRKRADELSVCVTFAGFLNQSELGRAYAVADCLVVPSERETWGLVVNEALATGLPVVVSDGVGCAPDLIDPDDSGEVFHVGDVAALAKAIARTLTRRKGGQLAAARCRARVRDYSFENATNGLVAAVLSLR